MLERDLILFFLQAEGGEGPHGDIEHEEYRALLRDLDLPQTGEGWLLIGKDGTEKARGNGLPDWEAIFRRIDRMPMRQREMREP